MKVSGARLALPLPNGSVLASLVSWPRVNLTQFHGVFEPYSEYPWEVMPACRGKGKSEESTDDNTPEQFGW